MTVHSFGCSFIYGTDLPDCSIYPSQLTWPALIAQYLGARYRCHAEPGAGNLRILNRLLDNLGDAGDLYIINWSFVDRFDYVDHESDEWHTCRPSGTGAVEQRYYRDLHSEYRDKFATLTVMHTAISALARLGARYIMTHVDDLVFCNRYHTGDGMQRLQATVAPHLQTFDGTNWLSWCAGRGHDFTASGHPVQGAHQETAQEIINRGLV
jgi:hypothetical protein